MYSKYLSSSKTKGISSGSKGMASTRRIIPARISKDLTKDIENTSKEVFKLLNLSGVCRIDYLIDSKKNKFYVSINIFILMLIFLSKVQSRWRHEK